MCGNLEIFGQTSVLLSANTSIPHRYLVERCEASFTLYGANAIEPLHEGVSNDVISVPALFSYYYRYRQTEKVSLAVMFSYNVLSKSYVGIPSFTNYKLE